MKFDLPRGGIVFKKLKPLRPTVVRKGHVVKICYYNRGTKRCLGPLCHWSKVGKCPILVKIKAKLNAK